MPPKRRQGQRGRRQTSELGRLRQQVRSLQGHQRRDESAGYSNKTSCILMPPWVYAPKYFRVVRLQNSNLGTNYTPLPSRLEMFYRTFPQLSSSFSSLLLQFMGRLLPVLAFLLVPLVMPFHPSLPSGRLWISIPTRPSRDMLVQPNSSLLEQGVVVFATFIGLLPIRSLLTTLTLALSTLPLLPSKTSLLTTWQPNSVRTPKLTLQSVLGEDAHRSLCLEMERMSLPIHPQDAVMINLSVVLVFPPLMK